jgi:signal transduction histidine kinase
MADRVAALEGRVQVVSSPGTGTCIRGELPLRVRAAVAV